MMREVMCATVLATATLFGGGCLVSKGSSVKESGVKVSQPTLAQIETGKTTESWLIATAGQPTTRTDVDERVHILRYEHTTTTKKGGSVFLIYAGAEREEKKSAAIFEITDGVVTKYWTET
jgi:hypothetical protein